MRLSLFVLLALFFLFLGILFRSYLYDWIVMPIAFMLLVLWRVVQSVDQAIYWMTLILAAVLFAIRRLAQRITVDEPASAPQPNSSLENVAYWRNAILWSRNTTGELNYLKRDLRWMVAALYALKQPDTSLHDINEALAQKQIPVPEPVYDFLYSAKSEDNRFIVRLFRSVRRAPGEWMRRWSGRELADYYHSIDLVVNFLESSLEINHDDDGI